MNQSQLLKLGIKTLKQKNIEEAEVKAKRLLEFILKQSRETFIKSSLEEVSNIKEKEYCQKLDEIIKGKPLQYITNFQEFMGLDFYVDENVLIPQPDTEVLAEQAIKLINEHCNSEALEKLEKSNISSMQVLDLCTGSGAIAISIAKYSKNVNIVASDISDNALEVAKYNAKNNKVDEKIQFINSDMFLNLNNKKFDVIVSNPPYIKTDVIDTLSIEVKQEPTLALDGGKDGLKFYKIILQNASNYMLINGYLLIEIGYDQGKEIIDLCKKLKGKNKIELDIITKKPIKDLARNDRVIIFKKV